MKTCKISVQSTSLKRFLSFSYNEFERYWTLLEWKHSTLRTNPSNRNPASLNDPLVCFFLSLSSTNGTMGWSGCEGRWTQLSAFLQLPITRILNTVWFCDLNICPWGDGPRLLTHYTQLSHEQIIHSLITPLNSTQQSMLASSCGM